MKHQFTLTSYVRGLVAELYVMAFLFLKGYRVLRWRYKTPVGEIDLIASKKGVVSFIEVKLRPSLDEGVTAVTPRMQSRISRAAGHFVAANPLFSKSSLRFDVVAVSGFRIRHLDNAWVGTP